MYDTYRSISGISVKELENFSLNEVALKFQQSTNKEFRNKCFVYVFKNVYPMLLGIHHSEKYSRINYDDKTEECLCCTLYAMEHWKPDRGQKLSSYINMVVNSCFKTMLSKQTTNNKHKVFDNLLNTDEKTLNLIFNSIKDNKDEKSEIEFLTDLENSTILNTHEVEYCKNLLNGYKTNKQMATQMNHIVAIPKYNKKMKRYVNISIKNENTLIGYCGQLRNSIKKKLQNRIHKIKTLTK